MAIKRIPGRWAASLRQHAGLLNLKTTWLSSVPGALPTCWRIKKSPWVHPVSKVGNQSALAQALVLANPPALVIGSFPSLHSVAPRTMTLRSHHPRWTQFQHMHQCCAPFEKSYSTDVLSGTQSTKAVPHSVADLVERLNGRAQASLLVVGVCCCFHFFMTMFILLYLYIFP